MSPRQRESRPDLPQTASESSGVVREGRSKNESSQSKPDPRVRSVLIEPRETEPPRVSVSVEYESEAPSVQALQKAAMETIHGVVRREGKLEDLGYRHQQRSRELVQTFECREKGKSG